MNNRDFKLFDDGMSAMDNGTDFRVAYFVGERQRYLYFNTREEAFSFVQNHPEADMPEIQNMRTYAMLYPL